MRRNWSLPRGLKTYILIKSQFWIAYPIIGASMIVILVDRITIEVHIFTLMISNDLWFNIFLLRQNWNIEIWAVYIQVKLRFLDPFLDTILSADSQGRVSENLNRIICLIKTALVFESLRLLSLCKNRITSQLSLNKLSTS